MKTCRVISLLTYSFLSHSFTMGGGMVGDHDPNTFESNFLQFLNIFQTFISDINLPERNVLLYRIFSENKRYNPPPTSFSQ